MVAEICRNQNRRQFKGGVRTQIVLNLKLNTFGAIEKCYLSFNSTPDISNDIFIQLQDF